MTPEFAKQLLQQVPQDYNMIAQHFNDTRQEGWPEFVWFTNPPKLQPGELLADIGCGSGRVTDVAAELQAEYVGVDVSAGLLELAKKQHPENIFLEGSLLDIPLEDEVAHVTTAIASLQHVPSSELHKQALQELWRITKPGGWLFMTNWNLYQDALPDYITPAKLEFGNEWEPGDALIPWRNPQGEVQAQRYYHAFRPEEMEELLAQSGWTLDAEGCGQHYAKRGERATFADGYNLVTIAQKPV